MRLLLSEDWLATIIGLAIVAVVALGLLGPGPQNVTVRAEPGESNSALVISATDFRITARLGDETVTVGGEEGTYVYLCETDSVNGMTENEILVRFGDRSRWLSEAVSSSVPVTFFNDCDQPASITYRTDAAIRFPLFNVFGR